MDMKCCVYTRFYFEIIFLDAFIKHYIQLGFDLILVLYHDIQKFEVPECYKDQVKLINVPNYGNYLPDMFRNNIPNDMDWVLHVDSDEFLFIHEKFATIKEFIKSKLEYEPTINVFSFLWAWCHNLDPNNILSGSIQDVAASSKVLVGTRLHQKKEIRNEKKEVWLKSMFKLNAVKDLAIHMPILKEPYVIHTLANEIIRYSDMNHRIKTFSYTESFWEDGFYKDSCLLHLSTRDIHNSVFKSYNIHSSQMNKKHIQNEKKFVDGIKNIDFKSADDLLVHFQKNIGYKFTFAFDSVKKLEQANFNVKNFIPKKEFNEMNNISTNDYSYYYEFNTFRNLINNTDYMLAINMIIEEYNHLFKK
jgi:hypothetical protein